MPSYCGPPPPSGGTQVMTWYGSMMSHVLQCTQFDALICSRLPAASRLTISYTLAGQKRVTGIAVLLAADRPADVGLHQQVDRLILVVPRPGIVHVVSLSNVTSRSILTRARRDRRLRRRGPGSLRDLLDARPCPRVAGHPVGHRRSVTSVRRRMPAGDSRGSNAWWTFRTGTARSRTQLASIRVLVVLSRAAEHRPRYRLERGLGGEHPLASPGGSP